MAEFTFDFAFTPRARQSLFAMSEADQADFESVIQSICADPWADNVKKFDMGPEAPELTLFADGSWSIMYRIVDNSVVEVLGIDRFDLGGALA